MVEGPDFGEHSKWNIVSGFYRDGSAEAGASPCRRGVSEEQRLLHHWAAAFGWPHWVSGDLGQPCG